MLDSFTLDYSRCAGADPSLRQDILARTGSDEATSGILRSIDRFGSDATILHYEISPKTRARTTVLSNSVAWSVRAIRPSRTPAVPPEA